MEASEFLGTVDAVHGEARSRGLFFRTLEDQRLVGRRITLDGREVLSFSSCSYLGLEHHPRLLAGVHDATDRFGTQLSASRGYISCPLYEELEDGLSQLFGGHALVTSSTTIAHQVALPVLATERDAIVLDHQVHHSVHMGATLARAAGATVKVVRHNHLAQAIDVVRGLAATKQTVWFCCDGVYSMYGDLAPLALLQELLDVAPNVRLYIDDAHGMSWTGRHGRGSFLSRIDLDERMVVATSLNKAFSAAGGALVFATQAERERVRTCGGPMVFSGPVQPPMLGAAVASTKVHLSDEIAVHQATLRARVDQMNRCMRATGLPLLAENEAPIFFVPCGLPRVAFDIAEKMLADGLYVNVSAYPSVPMKRGGIRIAINSVHSPDDVEHLVARLAEHFPAALAREGTSRADLQRLFDGAIPAESLVSSVYQRRSSAQHLADLAPMVATNAPGQPTSLTSQAAETELSVEVHDTIQHVDRDTWDRVLGTVGSCSWDAMATLEQVFAGQERPEHQWRFRYVLVHDPDGELVGATFFTIMLNKDDMLMRDEVSRAVEARRDGDPYFLTSWIVSMGSGFSEGNHLYLRRSGSWRQALGRILEVAVAMYEDEEAGLLLLRDLPADDMEMDGFLLQQGLVKVPMFDSHHLDVDWADHDGFLATLSRRKRRHMREIATQSSHWEVVVHGRSEDTPALSETELGKLYELYRNVANRKLRLNVFPLPPELIAGLQDSAAWEIVTLHLSPEHGGPEDGRPVAWYGAHKHAGHYAPFFCGLDYDFVFTHGAYRQMIYQMVRRAHDLGMQTVHMGMDADVEKARFGTDRVANCVYLQARDHFHGQLLRDIVAEVGVSPREAGA